MSDTEDGGGGGGAADAPLLPVPRLIPHLLRVSSALLEEDDPHAERALRAILESEQVRRHCRDDQPNSRNYVSCQPTSRLVWNIC